MPAYVVLVRHSAAAAWAYAGHVRLLHAALRAGTMADFFLGIGLCLGECHTLWGEGTSGGTCTNEMRAKCADGSFLFRCRRVR